MQRNVTSELLVHTDKYSSLQLSFKRRSCGDADVLPSSGTRLYIWCSPGTLDSIVVIMHD